MCDQDRHEYEVERELWYEQQLADQQAEDMAWWIYQDADPVFIKECEQLLNQQKIKMKNGATITFTRYSGEKYKGVDDV